MTKKDREICLNKCLIEGKIFQKPAASYQLYRILLNSIKIRVKLSTNILDRVGGGFTCNNSVMVNYPLSHLTPSFDDFAVEIAAKGNKSSPIHFPGRLKGKSI